MKFESTPQVSMFNVPMTLVKLNGKNYLLWAYSVEIIFTDKGLDQHLTYDKAEKTDPRAQLWKQEDD